LAVNVIERDAGLVRAVGPWGLAASIFSIVIGAGIFAVPGALAASMGVYAPVAFLVCGVVIGAAAICFAEGGSRIPTSGGIYGYIEAAFGPLPGYISGTLLWFGNALACGGIAAALADVAASVLPPRFMAPIRVIVIVGVIGGVALVNTRGITRASQLVDVAATLKLIPLAIFVIAGLGAMHRANFSHMIHPDTEGIGRALILATFLLTGMEVSLAASGEVRDPSRTIPRALAIGMVSVTLLYIVIQVIAQGILGLALAGSAVPLADAMARISPALRLLILAGAGLSMFGYISGDLLASPRILFAFGRDGLLPRAFGRVQSRTHAPHIAILSYAALAAGFALTGTFAELAVLSTLATAALYIAGCAAVWRLKRRGAALAGPPLNFRWLGAATVIAILGMLALIALASRPEILGLIALIAASSLIYLVQTRGTLTRR
jgi:amino acid transporter